MLKQFFVTGTDTGVGKTLTSAILMTWFNAYYWKPVQSGIAFDLSEQDKIKQLTVLPENRFLASQYSLQAELSPDQAARLENIKIDFEKLSLPPVKHHLIVEGAGGVFVPLNDQYCILDLMQKLKLSVIVVARGTIGTINHTLLTIDAIRSRNLHVQGVVFSGELNPENQAAIEKFGKVKTLFHVPQLDNLDKYSLKKWIDQNNQFSAYL